MLKIPSSSGTSLISVHPLFQKCFKSPAFIPHILLSTRLFPLISPLIVHFSNENSMYPFHFPSLPLSTFPSFISSPDSPSCPSKASNKESRPQPSKTTKQRIPREWGNRILEKQVKNKRRSECWMIRHGSPAHGQELLTSKCESVK